MVKILVWYLTANPRSLDLWMSHLNKHANMIRFFVNIRSFFVNIRSFFVNIRKEQNYRC